MLRTAAGAWSAQEASAIIIAEQSSQETHKRRNITGLHTYERMFYLIFSTVVLSEVQPSLITHRGLVAGPPWIPEPVDALKSPYIMWLGICM